MKLRIETMTCGGCVRGVTRAILDLDATATVTATPETRTVEVDTTASSQDILNALDDAGFPAEIQ